MSQRDDAGEAAFRALVARHAPMVLRICRDILGDWHEAEDASQATFIVLARKAGSIRKRDSVASWLFGVACRIAAQAKAKAARRAARRTKCRAGRRKIVQEDVHMQWLELYEEIDRLPERLRGPLVLCYLQGHSQPEAAALLGCPVRTLQNRLARRKSDCGVGSPAVVCTRRSDCGRRRWLGRDVGSDPGCLVGDDCTGRGRKCPSRVDRRDGLGLGRRDAEGMLTTMFRTKIKSIVAGVLAAGVLAVGIGMLAILTAGAPTAGSTGRRSRQGGSPRLGSGDHRPGR